MWRKPGNVKFCLPIQFSKELKKVHTLKDFTTHSKTSWHYSQPKNSFLRGQETWGKRVSGAPSADASIFTRILILFNQFIIHFSWFIERLFSTLPAINVVEVILCLVNIHTSDFKLNWGIPHLGPNRYALWFRNILPQELLHLQSFAKQVIVAGYCE